MKSPFTSKLSCIKRFFRNKNRQAPVPKDISPPTTPFDPTSLSFFSLPRELRDIIYTYAPATHQPSFFEQHRRIPLFTSPDFKITYTSRWHEPPLGRWILTSNRFFTGAIDVFTKDRAFTLRCPDFSQAEQPLSCPHVAFLRAIRAVEIPAARNEHDDAVMKFRAEDRHCLRAFICVRGSDARRLDIHDIHLQLDFHVCESAFGEHISSPIVFESAPLDEWSGCFGLVSIMPVLVAKWWIQGDKGEVGDEEVEGELGRVAEMGGRRLVGGWVSVRFVSVVGRWCGVRMVRGGGEERCLW